MSLNPGGRLAIITFHSLEDIIVKHTYEELEGRCTCPKDFPVCVCGYKSYGKIVNKKAIISKKEELDDYSLIPSKYIEFDTKEEKINYEEEMIKVQNQLKELYVEESQSKEKIKQFLQEIGYGI